MRCAAAVSFSQRGLEVDVDSEEAAHECLADAHEAEEEATEAECVGEHCDRGIRWLDDVLGRWIYTRLESRCYSFGFQDSRR